MTGEFQLGIVGTGLITSGAHLPAALGSPGVRVSALVDPVLERAAALARTFRISPALGADVADVLDRVDGLIIATPNSTHCEVALKCIAAGKHVLIEKPLANTVDEGNSIASAADERGVTAAVGFCTRFRPSVQLLKELLVENYFGEPRRFAHQFGTAGGWAPLSDYTLTRRGSGGGVLVVTGSHFLDRMLYFWGYPVTCALEDDGFDGPEANCTAHFTYPALEGVARYSKTGKLPAGFVLETSRGIAVLGETDDARIRFFPNARKGVCETITDDRDSGEVPDVFQLQIMDFVDACRTRRAPLVPATQGLASLRLTEELYGRRSLAAEPWASV